MAEEIKLTLHQQVLKKTFVNIMESEDENDMRAVLVSLLEDAKKRHRRDVTIEPPCARMEIRTVD